MFESSSDKRSERVKRYIQRLKQNMDLTADYSLLMILCGRKLFGLAQILRHSPNPEITAAVRMSFDTFLNGFANIFGQIFNEELPIIPANNQLFLNPGIYQKALEDLEMEIQSLHIMTQTSRSADLHNSPHQMDYILLANLAQLLAEFMSNNGLITIDPEIEEIGLMAQNGSSMT